MSDDREFSDDKNKVKIGQNFDLFKNNNFVIFYNFPDELIQKSGFDFFL